MFVYIRITTRGTDHRLELFDAIHFFSLTISTMYLLPSGISVNYL